MNNSETNPNTPSSIEQPNNIEQTRQPSAEEIKEFGSLALASYGPNGIFVERQTQEAQEPVKAQKAQIPETPETPTPTPEIPSAPAIQPEDITSVIYELEGVEWHKQPAQNTETPIETTSDYSVGSNEAEIVHESLAHKTLEKAKGSRAFKAILAMGLTATMALSLAACGADKESAGKNRIETTALSGEQSNGVTYDYSHYADREGKESANAYDYDMSDCYGDEEAFRARIMEVAARTPEALATYSIIFDDEERAKLGLGSEDSVADTDNAISNDVDGGDKQKQLLEGLNEVLYDKETTRFTFYLENDYETSSYMYFVDQNNDGTMTPAEMRIGKAHVKRSGAPQVNIERKVVTANGKTEWVKKADINLRCGGQINGRDDDFPDIPEIDPDDPTPSETPTEWGKEGDPHGGPDVTYSDEVDPSSEVSKEQNDNTNKGNQGYKDDNQAIPGSESDNNGTSNDDRLPGGEKQDDSQMNGDNPYRNDEEIEEGQRRDDEGNDEQEQAQHRGKTPGADNYSDEGEENPNNW